MSDDEHFDRWVAGAAEDYRQPPREIPREAMWEAIRAGVSDTVVAVPPARWSIRRITPFLAAAAVLVVVAYRVGVSVGARPASVVTVAPAPQPPTMYDMATRVLFDRADVLLTSTRAALGTDDLDPGVSRWAREMLSDTRLLLDSPAADQPARRALLEDLELILAQIAQLSAATTPDDRAHVGRALQGGDLLNRLRTSVPVRERGT